MFVVESTIRSATTASVGDLFLLLAASTHQLWLLSKPGR